VYWSAHNIKAVTNIKEAEKAIIKKLIGKILVDDYRLGYST